MSKSYWEIGIAEILSQHGINTDSETINSIASDVESGACVESYYSEPVSGIDEVEQLKMKIVRLENREPCNHCGGKGGAWVSVGTSHTSFNDCLVCNGKRWVY